MKQNQKELDTQEQPKHTENKEEHPGSKNIQVASTSGGHTQTNIDLLKVLNFVQENNANTFKLQQTIKNAFRYKSEPSGNVVNLSKHSFSFGTYKLNKNLNFILQKCIANISCLLIYQISFS